MEASSLAQGPKLAYNLYQLKEAKAHGPASTQRHLFAKLAQARSQPAVYLGISRIHTDITAPGMSLAQRYPNPGAAKSQHFPSSRAPRSWGTSPWRRLAAPTSSGARRCARRGAETCRTATAKLTAAQPTPKGMLQSRAGACALRCCRRFGINSE